jgi:hypothetical protein
VNPTELAIAVREAADAADETAQQLQREFEADPDAPVELANALAHSWVLSETLGKAASDATRLVVRLRALERVRSEA